MKLSTYANKLGISYKTAYRYYRSGVLNGYQMPTGTIIIQEDKPIQEERTAIYARYYGLR